MHNYVLCCECVQFLLSVMDVMSIQGWYGIDCQGYQSKSSNLHSLPLYLGLISDLSGGGMILLSFTSAVFKSMCVCLCMLCGGNTI